MNIISVDITKSTTVKNKSSALENLIIMELKKTPR